MTAHHWRLVRTKLASNGILDPLALPSLHALLDHIESIALESFVGGKTPEHDKLQREAFLDKLYAPDPEHRMLNGEEYVPKPSAFEDPKAIEDGFDSFMGAVSRRRAR